MSTNRNLNRRQFLATAAGTAAGVVGFPYLISSSALGAGGDVVPSERITMVIAGGHRDIRGGTKWIGDKGWVWVDRGNQVETEPKELKEEKLGPNDIHLYESPGHWRNFLDCVKSRKPTITPCETAHRSATPGHLGRIAMRLGRKIRFNPETEEIIGDPVASQMLGRALRSPWHL